MKRVLVVTFSIIICSCMYSGDNEWEAGDDDSNVQEPERNVISLINIDGELQLNGSPINPDYIANYPNPEAVDELDVAILPNGMMETYCTVAGQEVACSETPFFTNSQSDGNDGATVEVRDIHGELVADMSFEKCFLLDWFFNPPGNQTNKPPQNIFDNQPTQPDQDQPENQQPIRIMSNQTGEAPDGVEIRTAPEGNVDNPNSMRDTYCAAVNTVLQNQNANYEINCDGLDDGIGIMNFFGGWTPIQDQSLPLCYGILHEALNEFVSQNPNAQQNPQNFFQNSLSSQESMDVNNWSNNAMAEMFGNGVCRTSPLFLDLDGDGVRLSSLEDGVTFELFGNNEPVQCAWMTGADALLVLDHNQNGRIDDGTELFGTSTFGQQFENGFEALNEFDINGDGLIDSVDPVFDELRLWNDANRDGISAENELRGLLDADIQALELMPIEVHGHWAYDAHGNNIPLVSNFVRMDGTRGKFVDAFLRFRPIPH